MCVWSFGIIQMPVLLFAAHAMIHGSKAIRKFFAMHLQLINSMAWHMSKCYECVSLYLFLTETFICRCNYFRGFGLKLPMTPDDQLNKCTKYHEKMHNLYAKAIRLAIENRLHTNEKVHSLQFEFFVAF